MLPPVVSKLIARFHNFEAISSFKEEFPYLIVNKLHYFSPDIKTGFLSKAEENLYRTVLIEPAPGSPEEQEQWIEKAYLVLKDDPRVAYVHYDQPYQLYDQVPPLQDPNAPWFTAINCKNALNPYSSSEAKIQVAVIDTGIFHKHPDLDDFKGGGMARDFTNLKWLDGSLVTSTIVPINTSRTDNGDNEFHGTHVAGIIGALLNKTPHTIGLAHQETLMNLRAWWPNDPSDATLSVAIVFAADNGARVINASWGRKKKDANDNGGSLRDAINYACSKGVVVVCAAGNTINNGENVKDFIPASFDNVVVVGSIYRPDAAKPFQRYPESNYGKNVIGAPGVNISSLDAYDRDAMRLLTGTSMATAFVSGLVARMLAQNPNLLTPTSQTPCNAAAIILKLIVCDPLPIDQQIGLGMINVDKTLGL